MNYLNQKIGSYLIKELYKENNGNFMKFNIEKIQDNSLYIGFLIFRKSLQNSIFFDQLQKLIEIQGSIKHLYIQNLYDVIIEDDLMLLVFEYVKNNLLSLFSNGNTISEELSLNFFRQMLESILYLHSKNICHLDIKPDSFFFNENNLIKLSNFYLSGYFNKNFKIKGEYGTWNYSSIEVFSKEFCPFKADLWALGLVLYSLLTGTHLVFSNNYEVIQKEMKKINESILTLSLRIQEFLFEIFSNKSYENIILNIKNTKLFKDITLFFEFYTSKSLSEIDEIFKDFLKFKNYKLKKINNYFIIKGIKTINIKAFIYINDFKENNQIQIFSRIFEKKELFYDLINIIQNILQ